MHLSGKPDFGSFPRQGSLSTRARKDNCVGYFSQNFKYSFFFVVGFLLGSSGGSICGRVENVFVCLHCAAAPGYLC